MSVEIKELSPELQVIESMRSMTKYQQNKMVRLAIRLVNKDAKALKLLDKFESGFISVHQLLSAM